MDRDRLDADRVAGRRRGLTNREVAQRLFLAARTVQHHLASVYDKTGQRTRAGAAVFAIQNRLVAVFRAE